MIFLSLAVSDVSYDQFRTTPWNWIDLSNMFYSEKKTRVFVIL
jgi:hypothetical protein